MGIGTRYSLYVSMNSSANTDIHKQCIVPLCHHSYNTGTDMSCLRSCVKPILISRLLLPHYQMATCLMACLGTRNQ